MTTQFGGQVPQGPSPVAAAAPSQELRLLAAAAHLSFLIGFWLVAPLVIYFIKRKESRFVALHAMQAAVLHVLFFAAYTAIFFAFVGSMFGAAAAHDASPLVPFLMLGPMLGMSMGFLALCGIHAYAAYRAWEGNSWSIPLAGGIARRIIDADTGAAKG